MNLRLLLLVVCQGLFLTNNITFIAINGLVGLRMAPSGWLATLPLMGYVVGGALFTGLVARHQRAWGRRRAFQVGTGVAALSTGACGVAAATGSFTLLVCATVVAGYYSANASLYRFAASELVESRFQTRAMSWVLAGGVIGAVIGPNLARFTKDLTNAPFVGTYVALSAVAVMALALVSMLEFPPLEVSDQYRRRRSLGALTRQPAFGVAVVCSSLGYGVMNLLMAATPIAMARCGFNFSSTALVLEWHVLGMFVPSFFTGSLIRRIGLAPVLGAGVLLLGLCVAVALSGVEMTQFVAALLLLGVGWNFLYVGGSTLLTQAYQPHEKTTAQAAMDFCVYTIMAITSFSSGALVDLSGWQRLNLAALLPIVALAAMISWWTLHLRMHRLLRFRSVPPPLGTGAVSEWRQQVSTIREDRQ